MPEMEGHILAHWLRARYPSVPIFVMTGEDPGDPAQRDRMAAFDERLPKPIDPSKLLNLLGAYCGSRSAEAASGLAKPGTTE